ncbi:S8 family serine peptidase [Nonomuraea sp. SBT364]|uniref:S8 family serine peptidase n=1 Tax=Nonomuraea sp. SBT364 TaxID=1580530 RepID=UPI00066ACE95|nr:S8 family serine peptidase [Nonomuraea sp. SBT364]
MRTKRIMTLTGLVAALLTVLAPAAIGAPEPATRAICPEGADPAACLLRVAVDGAGRTLGPAEAAKVTSGPLTAKDLQEAYRLPSDLLGGGRTVAVVVPFDIASAEQDLAVYRKTNGLPACDEVFPCFRKVNQRGGDTPPPGNSGYAVHAAAGLDLASAACPNCKLLLVQADDATFANLALAVDQAVAQGADAVVPMWGVPEFEEQAAHAAYFKHRGVAITSASGSGFNTDGRSLVPAAYPTVIAVGGTELWRDPATERGWSESVWRETGSGCSLYETRPSWQRSGACGDQRTVADVASVSSSHTPVQIYTSALGGWAAASGTPLSAAFVAGVYGLAGTDSTTSAGRRLYRGSRYLFDVTTGANGACAGSNVCAGSPGYDGPSGMGTPNGTGAF